MAIKKNWTWPYRGDDKKWIRSGCGQVEVGGEEDGELEEEEAEEEEARDTQEDEGEAVSGTGWGLPKPTSG